jgi:sulfate adenylyltransferase
MHDGPKQGAYPNVPGFNARSNGGSRVVETGVCIWLTGLSGSGKTTTAVRLRDLFEQAGSPVTLLDGDIVREQLFPELGFTRVDRDQNVLRVAWVAAEIVRHGGIVICSLISPYGASRAEARSLVGDRHFVEVFVDTPMEICEARDVKGLYGRARRGEVGAMTGVEDPYEPPTNPDVTIATVGRSVDQNLRAIMRVLDERGLSRGVGESVGSSDPGGAAGEALVG